METTNHRQLKRLAAAFLLRQGYAAVATEVRCPGSRYRVDVAGYLDRIPWPREDSGDGPSLWSTVPRPRRGRDRRCEPQTILIECKQSRADFIRDSREQDALLAKRDELVGWQRYLEEHRIKTAEPELRRTNESLFPEFEEWDFAASRHTAYRKLQRRLRRLEVQIHGQTKFCLMARYRLANRLYLAAPAGMIRRREIPPGWGLLEIRRGALTPSSAVPGDQPEDAWRVAVEAPRLTSVEVQRARLLRNIAVAATRSWTRKNAAPASTTPVPPSPNTRVHAEPEPVPPVEYS